MPFCPCLYLFKSVFKKFLHSWAIAVKEESSLVTIIEVDQVLPCNAMEGLDLPVIVAS